MDTKALKVRALHGEQGIVYITTCLDCNTRVDLSSLATADTYCSCSDKVWRLSDDYIKNVLN